MNFKASLLWELSLVSLIACGCSTNQNIIRGQNPNPAEPVIPGPAYSYPVGSTYSNNMADGWNTNGRHGTYSYQFNGSDYCDQCPQDECDDHHCWHGHKHAHRHFYHYTVPREHGYPKELVYPQQNQPAAVVQYPYYTVKGPDDFFYQN